MTNHSPLSQLSVICKGLVRTVAKPSRRGGGGVRRHAIAWGQVGADLGIRLSRKIGAPFFVGQVSAGCTTGKIHQLIWPKIPYASGVIIATCDQPMAVCAEANCVNEFGVAVQDQSCGAHVRGGQIPQTRGAIETSCGQPVLVGAEGDRTDSALMAAQDPWIGGRVGGSQIPQARRAIETSCDQPVLVGTEGDRTDRFLMAA